MAGVRVFPRTWLICWIGSAYTPAFDGLLPLSSGGFLISGNTILCPRVELGLNGPRYHSDVLNDDARSSIRESRGNNTVEGLAENCGHHRLNQRRVGCIIRQLARSLQRMARASHRQDRSLFQRISASIRVDRGPKRMQEPKTRCFHRHPLRLWRLNFLRAGGCVLTGRCPADLSPTRRRS